ncbi:hypothetical protein NQ317_008340 [Molorchus minor]|uniref:endo-polygalacturonase n=1 Tax=Molorchus minor TaxID=1323400 RepID=A0ABQ9IR24_9CUCU|nr:hypothetical protein NQ317_008340 [Molorchus minor]
MELIVTLDGIEEQIASATPLNETSPRASCTVTSYSEVSNALSSCSDIAINDIEVPAGETLNLNLKDGAKLTFNGRITFGHQEWDGPLMAIKGNEITVTGSQGHVIDGEGALYWDGLGGAVIDGWTIDVSDGDTQGGHNTDGFDISASTNILVQNSVVKNQDDCVAVNQGSDMVFSNLQCSGSHGLSLSVGMSKTSYDANVVSNLTFIDCTVTNSQNAIHVKTHKDAAEGAVKDVTYQNIKFSDISNYGINIQEDYANGGSTGEAIGNIPITNLRMINIEGTVGSNAMPVYIFCGEGGCSDWTWSEVSVTGGSKDSTCNFTPSGYTC